MRFKTKAVHQNVEEDETTGAVAFPIYQTSTYSQDTPGIPRKYRGRDLPYARTENPTRAALETALAALEDAKYALSFATGLAAVTCILNSLRMGSRVVACADLYGGTYRAFTKVYAKLGICFEFIDTTDLNNVNAALQEDTAVLWLESPSNPLINITDIEGASEIAKRKGARVVVDNTFATPYLQRPLELGADVVLHSATKYLNGHADVVNGALLTNDEELYKEFKFIQNACGIIPGPQDCYLVLRGLKTLPLRMEQHCANAKQIAEFLNNHPKVERVYYPGLKSHPGHEIAKKQMRDFGGMLSFELKGSAETAKRFLEKLKLFTLAESLGCIQSLVCHPPSMTHASVEPEVRKKAGISDGLIRVSVGIEDVEDLIEDLEQAFQQV